MKSRVRAKKAALVKSARRCGSFAAPARFSRPGYRFGHCPGRSFRPLSPPALKLELEIRQERL